MDNINPPATPIPNAPIQNASSTIEAVLVAELIIIVLLEATIDITEFE